MKADMRMHCRIHNFTAHFAEFLSSVLPRFCGTALPVIIAYTLQQAKIVQPFEHPTNLPRPGQKPVKNSS